MTAQSEVVRISLYERIARDGLSVEQRNTVLRAEMRAYRDGLEQLCRVAVQAKWDQGLLASTTANLRPDLTDV